MSKKSIIQEEPVVVVKKTRKPRKPKKVVAPVSIEPTSEPVSIEPASEPVSEPKTVVVKKEKKPNKWIKHCKDVQSENPGLSYRDVLKLAKESYSKSE